MGTLLGFGDEFRAAVESQLRGIVTRIFLCGSALPENSNQTAFDIRTHLKQKIEEKFGRNCEVRMGEHQEAINAYNAAVESRTNLASYELSLAAFTDIVIIFPDSPGSFAELGMFSVAEHIARKMVIFIRTKFKESKSFVMYGPVALAEKNNARVIPIDYSDLETIWNHVSEAIRDRRQRQLDKRVIAGGG